MMMFVKYFGQDYVLINMSREHLHPAVSADDGTSKEVFQ